MAWQALVGPAIGLASSLIGGKKSNKALEAAAAAQQAATRPLSVKGPFGFANYDNQNQTYSTGLSDPLEEALGQLSGARGTVAQLASDPNFIQNEVQRLRDIAAPRENMLRASLRSTLFNQGRLGLGTNSGASLEGDEFANPEIAAQNLAFNQTDLSRVDQAQVQQQRYLQNLLSIIGAEGSLSTLPLQAAQVGIQGRTPAAATGGILDAGQQKARFNEAFFGSLEGVVGDVIDAAGGPLKGTGQTFEDFSLPHSIFGLPSAA